MGALWVRRLRLIGAARNYEVSFLDKEGQVLPLSIVAGQISTGKTSVLEYIAYCLGGKSFPQYPEMRSRVRAAQLECELQGATFVIERATVDQPSKAATVHSCALDGVTDPHAVAELQM
jgi:recombinational DNA repair ATPase RecF